jgi:hypothetical protein
MGYASRVKHVAICLLAAGCLSSTHVIPHEDLQALAQLPPEQRGQHVRVIQGFQGSDEPPPAPHVGPTTAIILAPTDSLPIGRPSPWRSAKGDKEDSKFWIVVAAFAAVGLAVTEGARWDGWVSMHPMQPVHLYGPMGEYTWVPLAQLDPQTAAWARKAFVREEEGPPWGHVERAPLDRRGGTYSLLLGAGAIVSEDGKAYTGFLSHIELGFAPVQTLVCLLDIGLGWSDNAIGSTIFESRTALELQLYLPGMRVIHPGVYGELGLGYRAEDYPPYTDSGATIYAAGGGIVQLELTTRLAITVRGGATAIYDRVGGELVGGLSIY